MDEQNMMEEIIFPKSIPVKKKKDVLNIFLYIILSILTIYLAVVVFTPKEKLKEPKDVTKNIDSLKEANLKLVEAQQKLDSINGMYDVHIGIIDSKLDSLGGTTVIIKEYYHDVISKPKKYSLKQIDSFFKSRYNY